MGRRDLDVLHIAPAVGPLLFDPDVRELHTVFVHREAVLVRPLLNLVVRPVRSPITVGAVTIPFLEKALVLALQLVLEDDAINARPCAWSRSALRR